VLEVVQADSMTLQILLLVLLVLLAAAVMLLGLFS
jgi:hypothetical protein